MVAPGLELALVDWLTHQKHCREATGLKHGFANSSPLFASAVTHDCDHRTAGMQQRNFNHFNYLLMPTGCKPLTVGA
jgi:hypothetical protein